MAKTRAQRKAEKRAREAEEQKQRSGSGDKRKSDARAQHDTQVPVSGDVAEIEAVEAGIAAGASEADLVTPDAPKPRSARRAEAKAVKQAEKRQREDQKRKEREQVAKRQKQAQAEKRQRGGVIGFLVSCWAELRKVQWPDRETLVQATAVTIIFVAVAGTYLALSTAPSASSSSRSFSGIPRQRRPLDVSLVCDQHLLRAREQGQAQSRAPGADDGPEPQRAPGRGADRAGDGGQQRRPERTERETDDARLRPSQHGDDRRRLGPGQEHPRRD